ncbi:MAG: hypothetical protein AMS27_11935 [Bacteroides sp. SM23_62_1]|nr:MAG: hypothetical protein AMS27_11935 [Bacteroides sp. SM23_62_1]
MKVTLFNEISLDGRYIYDSLNPSLYYSVAADIKCDAVMTGSISAKSGLQTVSHEEPEDLKIPVKDKNSELPYLLIPDSSGLLKGLLHEYRRLEYCRDVIVLLSNNSPREYFKYLDDRNYRYVVAGINKVDFHQVFIALGDIYNIKNIRSDAGGVLQSVLFEKGLVDRLILIISPKIIGSGNTLLNFSTGETELKYVTSRMFDKGYLYVEYEIII